MIVIIKISNDEKYEYSGHNASKVACLNIGDIIYCKDDCEHTIKYKYFDINTDTITISVL